MWLIEYFGILIIRFEFFFMIVWYDRCDVGLRFYVLFSRLFLFFLDGVRLLKFLWIIMWYVVYVYDFLYVCLILIL